jgi:hypothetical protein
LIFSTTGAGRTKIVTVSPQNRLDINNVVERAHEYWKEFPFLLTELNQLRATSVSDAVMAAVNEFLDTEADFEQHMFADINEAARLRDDHTCESDSPFERLPGICWTQAEALLITKIDGFRYAHQMRARRDLVQQHILQNLKL